MHGWFGHGPSYHSNIYVRYWRVSCRAHHAPAASDDRDFDGNEHRRPARQPLRYLPAASFASPVTDAGYGFTGVPSGAAV